MAGKSINPTICFKSYTAVQVRYLRLICLVHKLTMLEAIELYAVRFKTLYVMKHRHEIF